MADVHTKEVRIYNMSRIMSIDTKPEIQHRKLLFYDGFKVHVHEKNLAEKPDIAL